MRRGVSKDGLNGVGTSEVQGASKCLVSGINFCVALKYVILSPPFIPLVLFDYKLPCKHTGTQSFAVLLLMRQASHLPETYDFCQSRHG